MSAGAADIDVMRQALARAEGDVLSARTALMRATDMLAAMRRQLDVLSARVEARGSGGAVAAGVEAQVGEFGGGVVG